MLTPTGKREGGAESKEFEMSEPAAEFSVPQIPDLQEEDSYNSLHSGSGCLLSPSHAPSLACTRALSLPLSIPLSPLLSHFFSFFRSFSRARSLSSSTIKAPTSLLTKLNYTGLTKHQDTVDAALPRLPSNLSLSDSFNSRRGLTNVNSVRDPTSELHKKVREGQTFSKVLTI